MSTMPIQYAVAALLLGGTLALSACAGATSTATTSADDRAARCERDRGVWRPQIAGGYCEMKP